jgi:thiopurine S-methyltransferase
MDHGFWRDRWREGKIGFHEGRPNAFLERHGARLGEGRRVLVPLCGKTADLAYLAGLGHEVVGVELVEDAVRAFFAERELVPEVTEAEGLVVYRADAVTIIAGDWFATTREVVGAVDAVYDRAAVIALPGELRARYAAHLRSLIAPDAPALVVTLEYDPARMDGPPFPVVEDELRALHAGCTIEALDEAPAGGKIAELGIAAIERCFLVR